MPAPPSRVGRDSSLACSAADGQVQFDCADWVQRVLIVAQTRATT